MIMLDKSAHFLYFVPPFLTPPPLLLPLAKTTKLTIKGTLIHTVNREFSFQRDDLVFENFNPTNHSQLKFQ